MKYFFEISLFYRELTYLEILILGILLLLIIWGIYTTIIKISDSNYRHKVVLHATAIINYFKYFGWVYLMLISSYVIVYIFIVDFFIWYFWITILGFLIIDPLKFIYTLVGARNSLRTFFLLFITTQLLFTSLYVEEIDRYNTLVKNNNILITDDKLKISTIEMNTYHVLLNTVQIALIQDISPTFQKVLENPDTINKNRLQIILIVQIFISWIYLGVFIASIYQKLRNE